MSDILKKIEAYKRKEIGEAKLRMPRSTLERRAHDRDPPRGFVKAIEAKLEEGRIALIAEIKKASPSKGVIRKDFDPPSRHRLWEGRCSLPFGSHRCAVLSRQARLSRSGTARHPSPRLAQGLHVRPLSGL